MGTTICYRIDRSGALRQRSHFTLVYVADITLYYAGNGVI